MTHYNIDDATKAQARYCKVNNYPHFAPYDGICYRCHKNIYTESDGHHGISVENAGTHLITGCPHCHYSFCE